MKKAISVSIGLLMCAVVSTASAYTYNLDFDIQGVSDQYADNIAAMSFEVYDLSDQVVSFTYTIAPQYTQWVNQPVMGHPEQMKFLDDSWMSNGTQPIVSGTFLTFDSSAELKITNFGVGNYWGTPLDVDDSSTVKSVSFEPPKASPVPIPGAVWLLGSGLVGLVVTRRKKKNS